MKMRYQAFSSSGGVRTGVIEAASVSDATEQLRREALFVTQLHPIKPAGASRRVGGGGRRVRAVANFCRQMAVLVSTGTRIVDALSALERQARDSAFKPVVADLRRRVEEGVPFSEALHAHPAYFDAVAVSLARAGESSGRLDLMLQRLADITLQQMRLRQQVVGALAYPCVLLAISAIVLVSMLMFVLPRFAVMFDNMQVPLPPTTQALMAVSNVLTAWWWIVFPALAGVIGGLVMWTRAPVGRAALHAAAVRVPIIGRAAKGFTTARLSRLLGLLMDSKVPLLESLELVRDSLGNLHYRSLLARSIEAVQRGDALSLCLSRGDLVDPAVIEALKNAERSGTIGPVLISMADFLDDENKTMVKTITGLLEPAILIVLGLVVGFIATSMFLPLFDLTGSGGGAAP